MQRAQIVLVCRAGETNTVIAKRMGVTGMTVGQWRKRYQVLGLAIKYRQLSWQGSVRCVQTLGLATCMCWYLG